MLKANFPNCGFFKFSDSIGMAEHEGGVKRGISLESLCSHKQIKSNPPLECHGALSNAKWVPSIS